MSDQAQEGLLTEQNVALMREAYDRIGTGAWGNNVAWELIADDVIVRDRPEIPDPQVYRGREGLIKAVTSSDESFDEFGMRPTDIIGVGESHVVIVLRMWGRGRGSGVHVEETIAHQWRVRDGKAAELQVYSDPDDALRDARSAEGLA
jgi:ketosteroid isomerase-like protein